MDTLTPFLNRDELTHRISTSMSDILACPNELQIDERQTVLGHLLDALPPSLQLDPLPVAGAFFDSLLRHAPAMTHYRLLSSCLKLMHADERRHRMPNILLTILDLEQTTQLRELLCKLLNTTESVPLNLDWTQFESIIAGQHDPKFITYVWRFLSKHHAVQLEQILLRTLSSTVHGNDELSLLLLIESRSTAMFVPLPSFWCLLKRSLGDTLSNNDRTRKLALYLLKHVLVDEAQKDVQIKDERSNRYLALIDQRLKQFWIDFIVIYEALEDGVVHLIKPLLTKFDRLLNISLEHGN